MYAHYQRETMIKLPVRQPGEYDLVRWQRIYRLASRVFNDMCFKSEVELDQMRSTDVFKRLSYIWGSGYFNTRQNIGSPTLIYKEGECESTREFYEYYFYTSTMPIQDMWAKGRNLGQLCQIGIDFYQYACEEKGYDYDIEQVFECMWISMFYLTHLGVQRELKTLANLRKDYPLLDIREANIDTDYGFGVDCEAWYQGMLIMGFQIKSQRFINQMKRKEEEGKPRTTFELKKQKFYQERYNVPVYTLVTDAQGEVIALFEIEDDQYVLGRIKAEKRAKKRQQKFAAKGQKRATMKAYCTYDPFAYKTEASSTYQPDLNMFFRTF